MYNLILLIVGLGILTLGAHWLVSGSTSFAKKLGVSELVIGLTVVAFGTSLPEMVVNLIAALSGSPDIALGNVVGSNIANTFLILGVSSLFGSLAIPPSTRNRELPLIIFISLILYIITADTFLTSSVVSMISRTDGLLLLVLCGVFITHIRYLAKSKSDLLLDEIDNRSVPLAITLTIAGLAGLYFGGNMFVHNATILATNLGVSELVIGLTIISIGTSLPELVTSVIAVKRGFGKLAIGNIIGSNIINITWVLGFTAVIAPVRVPTTAHIDIAVLLSSILIFALFVYKRPDSKITWKHGLLFLALYGVYLAYLLI